VTNLWNWKDLHIDSKYLAILIFSHFQGDPYVIHDSYYYTQISGSKLGSIQTKAYTTEAAAAKACKASKATCSGFVLTSKKYYLTKGYMMYTDNDYTAFVRNHGYVIGYCLDHYNLVI